MSDPIAFYHAHIYSFASIRISNIDSAMRGVRTCCQMRNRSWPEDRIIMSETRESVHGPRSAPTPVRAAMFTSISTTRAAYYIQQDVSVSVSGSRSRFRSAGECGVIRSIDSGLPHLSSQRCVVMRPPVHFRSIEGGCSQDVPCAGQE
jgi:hypothetical protein